MLSPEIIEPVRALTDAYTVEKYDVLCEPHFRIKKIVGLKKTPLKIAVDVFLNIITIGLINYLYGFSDSLVKFMRYTECPLQQAKLLGIYCCDGQFYFEELKTEVLPVVDNPDVFISQAKTFKTFLFTFKLFTYIFNPSTNAFSSIKYNIYHSKEEIYNLMSSGLKQNERIYQSKIYGECDLNFHIDSFLKTLFKNSCTFFFAFQIYAIILWNCTDYYFYAGLIAALTLFDLLEETISGLSNLKSIRRMAKYSVPVKIYKKTEDNSVEIMESESINLVPGDIFELPDNGMAMPCDCILLSGSVIINEAMLTGESTPIIKSHLPNIKQNFDEEIDSKYFLYAGTKIVQKRSENKKPIIALVYATGFNSVKGNLIRSILYPLQGDSKFERESSRFMIIMAILCVIGYIAVLPTRIIYAMNLKDDDERKEEYIEIVNKGLDLITTAVPPSLPCCLGIGIGTAQRTIKKKGIMCINRNKITSAGKINICVFDKTGTLTEDHLNIAGFLPVEAHGSENKYEPQSIFTFDRYYESVLDLSKENFNYYKEKLKNNNNVKTRKKELRQLYIECLACCHGATRVDNKIIGDPIDVEMFESTGWELIEECEDVDNYNPKIAQYVRPKEELSLTEKLVGLPGFDKDPDNKEIKEKMKDHYEIGIVRRFDFSSKLQRMSTLAKNLIEPHFTCFCKGSPEKIKELCQPKTIPADFVQQLNYYTSRGYRVLAMGSKIINMSYENALDVSRSYCEKDLIFLGLLIVQNKLKLATNPTLRILSNDGQIRVRMATGDNIMTAVCVGRKSNLIEPDAIVYSCEIEEEKEEEINEITTDRKSMGILKNSANIEIEKERRRKKLVWKTIESFQEDEDLKGDIDTKEENKLLKTDTIISTSMERPSFLIPMEISPDDCKIEDEGSQNITVGAPEKKDAPSTSMAEDDDDDFIVDLTAVPFKEDDEKDIELAITGKTFEVLYRLNKKYEDYIGKTNKQKESNVIGSDTKLKLIDVDNLINEDENKAIQYKHFHDAFRLVLKNCSVYARCSPENKAQIVQSLQKESFTVLMCGDGANDCSALKVADVGVSLSTEEASIAAPFTSRTPDISCVIELLKEGKCALVTSFQIFKYILLYSLIQFISVTLLIFIRSYLSDWQFMASDLFLITPFSFLMPLTPAYPKLTHHRPVSSLFSFPILFSMGIQTICVCIFQVAAHIATDKVFPKKPYLYFRICDGGFNFTDFDPQKIRPWENYTDGEEEEAQEDESGEEEDEPVYMECIFNSTNFYVSFAQYLILAVVFCTGKPFKKNIIYNYGMLIFAILGFLYSEYIVFYVDIFSRKYMQITPYPDDHISYFYDYLGEEIQGDHSYQFKFIIMGFLVLNFIACLILEKVVVHHCSICWRRKRMDKNRRKLEADVNKEATLYLVNDVKNYIKEQKNLKKI